MKLPHTIFPICLFEILSIIIDDRLNVALTDTTSISIYCWADNTGSATVTDGALAIKFNDVTNELE